MTKPKTGTGSGIEPLFVDPAEAGRLLNVSRTRVFQLLAEGELLSVKDGRRRLISVESIRKLGARLLDETRAAS